jgi:crotonobetainyl-CoA:carnitine CoA-transferase CaiB-like acyl-CoA transferase
MSRLNVFLKGVRILDLSRHLPGPLATLFLGDMGAEVLKIEPPAGDEMRVMGPIGSNGRSVYFDAVNAGKTVRRLDFKRPDDRLAYLDLVKTADVVIDSFRPGVMSRLGVGYETLKASNPRLIHCSLNGFGEDGPLAARAAHDVNYLSLAGTLFHNDDGGTPFFDPPVADCAAALFAALTIVGALHGRARDGKGCHIDLALADVTMPLQIFHLAAFAQSGMPPRPSEGLLNGGAACYRVYRTADNRRVSLGALEPKFWRAFCAAAARPEWEARHRDPLPQAQLAAEVATMFGALTLAECEERFGRADCCFAPVLDLAQALESPHVRSRGLVQRTGAGELQPLFPAVVDGERPMPRVSIRAFDTDPGRVT